MFRYIKQLPYKEGMNKLYTLYPREQVETILNKIYEEHKNLEGLPIPSDFLARNPHMKNLGALNIEKHLARGENLNHPGLSRLPDLTQDQRFQQNSRIGSMESSQRPNNIFQQNHPMDGTGNIFKPSLKNLVLNKKKGMSKASVMSGKGQSNHSMEMIREETESNITPVHLTQSRVENLAQGSEISRMRPEGNAEHALVEKYLKGLARKCYIYLQLNVCSWEQTNGHGNGIATI